MVCSIAYNCQRICNGCGLRTVDCRLFPILLHVKKHSPPLPVYNIETFRNKNSRSPFFDIKLLEEHVRQFEVTHHPHRHDFYLVLFVTQGEGVHTMDFVEYAVKPFSVFFLTPGQVHAWRFTDDAKGFVIFFTSAFYRLFQRSRQLSDFPFFHSLTNSCYLDLGASVHSPPTFAPSGLRRAQQSTVHCNADQNEDVFTPVLREMMRESQLTAAGRDEILHNYLDIFLLRLARRYEQPDAVRSSPTLTLQVRKLEGLIEANFRTLKQPHEYAGLMNVTPRHLNDICKRGLNKTISELIQERLLLEIKRLLTYRSTTTIKELADTLGFHDKSYLMRFFKKHTGMTIDQFREEHGKHG
jgi:AraC family transcriptional regulator, transcriptional activator of pobA